MKGVYRARFSRRVFVWWVPSRRFGFTVGLRLQRISESPMTSAPAMASSLLFARVRNAARVRSRDARALQRS